MYGKLTFGERPNDDGKDQIGKKGEEKKRKSRKWDELPDSPSKEYWRRKADQIPAPIKEIKGEG